MLSLGSLAFTTPWILLGLLALPAIWWLLRISPPLPKRVRFPAIRLLVGLAREEETPAHTPLWLLLLRLALAAIIVMALAGPVWNPAPAISGQGPLLIVVDNGWASATHWRTRSHTLDALITGARRDSRPVLLLGTAPEVTPPALEFANADDAAAIAAALKPQPLSPDRAALAARLDAASFSEAPQIIWLGDGIDYGSAKDFASALTTLANSNGVEFIEPEQSQTALALLPPSIGANGFTMTARRAAAPSARSASIHALNAQGGILASVPVSFASGKSDASAALDLPLDLRNKVTRLEIAGENSAGAVNLLDESARRRTVGLISGAGTEENQQLLSDLYYLERAIAPYAALRKNDGDLQGRSEIAAMLSAPLSVLILADIGNLTMPDRQLLTSWVEQGGVLIRFAGPKLAGQGPVLASDSLMPVPLRMGGRALGGTLSWTDPQHLAPFEPDSPFFGLNVPDDVTVSRQVLAEPTIDLGDHTWARLTDGTPLVTSAVRDKGLVVLFHVTANSDWSNLPLSGLFVDMLRKTIGLSQGLRTTDTSADKAQATSLPPVRTLDGFGKLGIPPATATPLPAARFADTAASPRHPPGLYGPADGARAFNLVRTDTRLAPVDTLPDITNRHAYAESAEWQLRPALLLVALCLIIADALAALYVTGLFDTTPIRRRRRGLNLLPALLVAIAFTTLLPRSDAHAAGSIESFALDAANETRLAYVLTGDATTDEISRAGLEGLSAVLRNRTSFSPAAPVGVDVSRDELAFFPLLYWPVTSAQATLPPEALSRVNAYMEHGGTILFDTRDQDSALSGIANSGNETLKRLVGGLDLPALEPVPATHVLTKSFYLLQSFPGRFTGAPLWVQRSSTGTSGSDSLSNDGVSAVIIGGNDYASAWARDASGRPMFPCEPGGERQREIAYRFGVNLVMYTLTGNYKSDQVHIPALLERLGN